MTGPHLNPGETFKGYVVEKSLGSGANGSVWLVRHEFLDTLFAMKTTDASSDEESVKRFIREAKLANRIKHPNLAQVYDAGYDDERGLYYLVMDYVEGETLRTAIALGGPMEENRAIDIILQVCDVLSLGGRFGMVHRDLKPENIMLTRDGSAKLLDFGIAKSTVRVDSLLTMANTVFGTPGYMAPEQAADSSAVNPSADVYSLGIILYELLTGHLPWSATSTTALLAEVMGPKEVSDVRLLAPSVSAETADIIRRMCIKNPEERLQSADDVIAEFAKCGHYVKAASGKAAAADEGGEESMDDLLSKLPDPVDAAPTRRSGIPWLVVAIAAAVVAGIAAACYFALR